ncbi:hypothetical protein NKH54_31225 [Mesorhizobium sp. M1004]|uniref:hypothetical protein n=1 Tax=Mesorhizobium sp. M1004 TaxID=2957046 RepID=UPI0033357E04
MTLHVESVVPPIELAAASPSRAPVRERADTLERAGTILPAISGGMLLLAACFLAIKNDLEPTPENAASGAPAYVREHGASGNVLNADNLGGTLILHGIKTYIDTRADQLFLDGFASEDYKSGSSAGKPVLEKLIAEHDIAWALLAAGTGASPPSMNSEAGGKHTKMITPSSIYGKAGTSEFEPSP